MALQGFDEAYYLNAKLASLQATFTEWGTRTADDLKAYLETVGFTPESHYQTWGWTEGLAPNAFFNEAEYIEAKGKSLFEANLVVSIADGVASFKENWSGNPYDHYLQYGAGEGVDPSNDFDSSAYLAAKLVQLQTDDPELYGDWTVDDVSAAFTNAGLTPLGHFVLWGADEGLTAPEVPPDEQIDPETPEEQTGETFTLTDGIDVSGFTGTAVNDTYIATDATYTTGDSLNGAGGTDKLNLTLTAVTSALVDMTSVEVVNVRTTADTSGANDELDASGWSGVEQIWSDRSTDDLKVINVAELAAVGVRQGNGSNMIVEFAGSVVSGDDDEVAVVLENADAGSVVINNVETFNVTSGGTSENELTTLEGNAFKAMTVTGAQNLTIATALAADVASVDATGATGDIAIEVNTDVSGASDELSVTLGSGDDILNTGDQLNNASVSANATVDLDGGEGTDILAVDAQIDSDVDVNEDITNFEILQIEADVAYDLDGYDWVEEVNLNNAITAGKVIDNIAAGVTTNLLVNTADVELSHVDASEVGVQSLAVSIGGAANVTAGTLTVDGVENIFIESTGADEDNVNIVTAMENDALRALTITGDNDLDLTPENIADTVDAGELTGELTLDLSAQANAIEVTVGSGGSEITIDVDDANAHNITLGAGVDTISLLNENTAVDALAEMMTITGFTGGEGGDVFALDKGAAFATDAELALIQADVDAALEADSGLTLQEAADAAASAFTAVANDVYWFELGSNTHVVYEDGTDVGKFDVDEDFIVELVGTDLGLDAEFNFTV